MSSELWIFGYGSLIWRPGFPFRERRLAYASGWHRRLEQGSPDHRGTPARLGRVATLVPAPGARCGGVAYAVDAAHREAVLADLDVREQGGYERIELDVALVGEGGSARASDAASEVVVRAVTWIASPGNPFHLGPGSFLDVVEQVRTSVGPSGTNLEYVLRLVEALRSLELDDEPLIELAAALTRVET